jgi:hypothetical protein
MRKCKYVNIKLCLNNNECPMGVYIIMLLSV